MLASGFIFFFCIPILGISAQTPSYIKPCRKSDPDLNTCAINSISHFRDHLIVGIPELDLPPLDPLRIPRLQVENGVGRIRVRAIFSDLTIYGPANHTLTDIRANIDDYTLDLGVSVPRLVVTGRYEVIGNVLVINIRSKGDFQAVFEDVSGLARLHGEEVILNGVKYMKVGKAGIRFQLGNARFRIRDRSTNNRVLSEAINNFLNQNWREVMEEVRQTASTTIENYVVNIANTALLKVPLELWLKDN